MERNVRLDIGEQVNLGGDDFTLTETGRRRGPNFLRPITATIEVAREAGLSPPCTRRSACTIAEGSR